jgi:acetyl-CoA synthetase (ADP-forming)
MVTIRDFMKQHKGKTVFPEHEVKGLLKEHGFPVPKGIFISRDHLPAIVDIFYPLVAKVSSSKIVSKSEIGGIRTGLSTEDELKKAVADLLKIEGAEGVLIEEMAKPGLEVIIGGIIDEQFGPIVMFGLGGVFVELFKDIAFTLAPMNNEDALWLIKQIKGYSLFEGYRGTPPVDIQILIEIIIKVSELIATGLIKELTLNPVSLYPEGAMVLDAKMLVNC